MRRCLGAIFSNYVASMIFLVLLIISLVYSVQARSNQVELQKSSLGRCLCHHYHGHHRPGYKHNILSYNEKCNNVTSSLERLGRGSRGHRCNLCGGYCSCCCCGCCPCGGCGMDQDVIVINVKGHNNQLITDISPTCSPAPTTCNATVTTITTVLPPETFTCTFSTTLVSTDTITATVTATEPVFTTLYSPTTITTSVLTTVTSTQRFTSIFSTTITSKETHTASKTTTVTPPLTTTFTSTFTLTTQPTYTTQITITTTVTSPPTITPTTSEPSTPEPTELPVPTPPSTPSPCQSYDSLLTAVRNYNVTVNRYSEVYWTFVSVNNTLNRVISDVMVYMSKMKSLQCSCSEIEPRNTDSQVQVTGDTNLQRCKTHLTSLFINSRIMCNMTRLYTNLTTRLKSIYEEFKNRSQVCQVNSTIFELLNDRSTCKNFSEVERAVNECTRILQQEIETTVKKMRDIALEFEVFSQKIMVRINADVQLCREKYNCCLKTDKKIPFLASDGTTPSTYQETES